jgi:hypothetical protein
MRPLATAMRYQRKQATQVTSSTSLVTWSAWSCPHQGRPLGRLRWTFLGGRLFVLVILGPEHGTPQIGGQGPHGGT